MLILVDVRGADVYRGPDDRSSVALPEVRRLCTSQHHLKGMTRGESRPWDSDFLRNK